MVEKEANEGRDGLIQPKQAVKPAEKEIEQPQSGPDEKKELTLVESIALARENSKQRK